MRESWVKSLAWILVVLFPASLVMADATSAMLIASGDVTVNGSPIEQATAVFPGDKVHTGPNALARVTNQGSSVTVAGNSSLVFSKSFVNVLCGTALISTDRGLSVRVSNLLVQPARGVQTRFQITQNEGQLQVIAREGTLAVDNGAATTSLEPGRMLTASANCMAAPYADDQTGSSPTGGQDNSGQQTANNSGNSNKKNKNTGGAPISGGSNYGPLLLAGALVVGGGIGAAIATTLQGSSPPPPPTSNVVPTTSPLATGTR